LTLPERAYLHFHLGHLYDRTGEYDRAFSHFRQGNNLVQSPYDSDEHHRLVSSLIRAYDPASLATHPRATLPTEQPIFIVGMPRSGTTLVEQILTSHPRVYGAGELDDLSQIAAALPRTLGSAEPYPRCLDTLTQAQVDALAQQHLAKLAALSGNAPRVTDKMPLNFLNLGLIALLFPHARVIHCTRDPLDTCLSCYFCNFAGNLPYTYDLAHLGQFYKEYTRLMRHWKKVLPVRMREVSYEQLVADPEAQMRALVAFCGLDWDGNCLEFHNTERAVMTASDVQVRRPIYNSSVGLWRRYEKHLAPLLEALGRS
jgi:hypothetical protein